MYNDPIAIRMLAERVLVEMGWAELLDRRISQDNIHNLVRAMIRPVDDYSGEGQKRIISEAIRSLRRLYPKR